MSNGTTVLQIHKRSKWEWSTRVIYGPIVSWAVILSDTIEVKVLYTLLSGLLEWKGTHGDVKNLSKITIFMVFSQWSRLQTFMLMFDALERVIENSQQHQRPRRAADLLLVSDSHRANVGDEKNDCKRFWYLRFRNDEMRFVLRLGNHGKKCSHSRRYSHRPEAFSGCNLNHF